jgi:NAD(P)-dependent dehydrogenase (short-subunit alcohol dehydrogenase family)
MSDLSQSFAGKTAIITGASKGIGFGIAEELVSRGASVCITARKEDELAGAVSALDPDGTGQVIAVRGRTEDADHQRATVDEAMAAFGRVDIVVNNVAAYGHFGPIVDAPMDALRGTFEVNVFAALAWCQLAWHAWQKDNGGAIVNVASIGGLTVGAGIGVYNISKAALIHLTRQLSLELAPMVRVNAIAPALVKTDAARGMWEPNEELAAEPYPLKRLGATTDTAKLAAFLLSDDASWITGQTIVADGGITQVGGP